MPCSFLMLGLSGILSILIQPGKVFLILHISMETLACLKPFLYFSPNLTLPTTGLEVSSVLPPALCIFSIILLLHDSLPVSSVHWAVSSLKAESLCLILIPQCLIKYLMCCKHSYKHWVSEKWVAVNKIICSKRLFNLTFELHYIEIQKER